MGIDFQAVAAQAATPPVERCRQLIRDEAAGRKIMLSVDRDDEAKAICLKLEAFRTALKQSRELIGQVSLTQIVLPGRESASLYQDKKTDVEELIRDINREFARPGWIPVQYHHRRLTHEELLAYYRAADIALVMPLKDGMNLAAKEYCAAQKSADGVLILSEFTGAAGQLSSGALLVNPYNIEGVAQEISRAVFMSEMEKRIRMQKLRRAIKEQDIYWWCDTFLQTAYTCHAQRWQVKGFHQQSAADDYEYSNRATTIVMVKKI
jgi:trehalose-6-phosphate synthase